MRPHPPEPRLPRLLLITDRLATRGGRSLEGAVEEAIAAGVRFVCLREKDLPDQELLRLAQSFARELRDGGTLVVNGRPVVAAACGAGLHLPARSRLEVVPVMRPFGRSVHDSRELDAALSEDVDYVVAGNVFPTDSKPGRPGRGLEWLRQICVGAGAVPVYGIGGIDRGRVEGVIAAGAYGIAVRGAIMSTAMPGTAVRELHDALARAARLPSRQLD